MTAPDRFVLPTGRPSRRVAPVTPLDSPHLKLVTFPGGRPAAMYDSDDNLEADPSPLFSTMWFDPGGTTGWAVVAIYPEAMKEDGYRILENIAFWSCGEFTGREDEQVDAMLGLVEAWQDSTVVGLEDFKLRQFRQDADLLAPVRISAAFEYELRGTGYGKKRGRSQGRRALKQQPSLAMTSMTDERLKACGLYPPTIGKEHARDAVRHAFTYLRRQRDAFLKNKGLLKAEGEE